MFQAFGVYTGKKKKKDKKKKKKKLMLIKGVLTESVFIIQSLTKNSVKEIAQAASTRLSIGNFTEGRAICSIATVGTQILS